MGIKKAILEVEYAKVGGKDIYDTVNKATQMQMQQQLPQIKEYIKNGGGAQGATTAAANNGTPLTPDEIATLKKDAVIEGNKDANILVIEYSDMECPFCMKQYHDTKLFEKVAAQYTDKVGLVYKNNRGFNHPGTEIKALWALCAQKLGGDAAYTKFYKAVMDGSTNEWGVYDVTKLNILAKNAGVDEKKWQECVDTKEMLPLFASQTSEAAKFSLTGTPGTLIVNLSTGKYETVVGAYPYDEFTKKIDLLMK